MRIRYCYFLFIVAFAAAGFGQQQRAARATASAALRGKNITVDYSRPELKGRQIDALLGQLPPDRIWRAGANEVTTLSTETDLMIGDKKVPAGKYSLYVHAPENGNWSLVVNRDLGIELIKIYPAAPPAVANHMWPRLDGYSKIADKEVARVAMKSAKLDAPVDTFTITLAPESGRAVLKLAWGDRSWSVDFRPAA